MMAAANVSKLHFIEKFVYSYQFVISRQNYESNDWSKIRDESDI